jgi:hypothetical protein
MGRQNRHIKVEYGEKRASDTRLQLTAQLVFTPTPVFGYTSLARQVASRGQQLKRTVDRRLPLQGRSNSGGVG